VNTLTHLPRLIISFNKYPILEPGLRYYRWKIESYNMKPQPQAISFTGSIPSNYDHYLGPLFFEDYAIDVCSRVNPTAQRALELCCGTGRVTNHLRKVLGPGAELIASDISEDMLAIAKEKLKNENIEWRIIDAQQIPLEAGSRDLVVCCFGYMLVPDKQKAFSEALRVLRPGGTLLMSTWDKLEKNHASDVFRKTLKQYLGDSLPEGYKLPYSMHDPESIKKQLLEAGFTKVSIDIVEKVSPGVSANQVAYGLIHGGSLYNEIVKKNPSWIKEISDVVERELTVKYGSEPMLAPMSALICQAVK
jgi:ubiquinone/menaquinone biosynthesis C-methylase UbiE